jgi:two-component system phosphate regulon sensor histidine kinase PhoR
VKRTAVILAVLTLAGLAVATEWQPLAGLVYLAALLIGALSGFLLAPREKVVAETSAPPSLPAEDMRPGEITASNALLETMMESMREVMLAVDRNLYVLASNRAARDFFRQSEEAMTHRRLAELTENTALHDAFQLALMQGERAEATIELPDGADKRTFALRVTPLRFRRDTPQQGAVGVFFDITKLERLEKVRQEFLSNVSHELRTPLTSILAFVETLEDGGLEDAANNRRFLAIIRRNSERMRLLMEDILELSAIEAGKIHLETRETQLAPLVENIFAALTARAQERQVSLRHEIAPDAKIYADPRRLEQMLTNLIDNAVKFNRPEGAVTVAFAPNGARDRIRVKDTGEGIPAEHLPRLFERFYRVDRARSREMGGTGLGLAIVKHLARAHGGEASVESEIGEGTTFMIELPGNQVGVIRSD